MRKLTALFFTVLLAISIPVTSFGASDPPDPEGLAADTAILIDAKSGQILYELNPHKQKYPASTTKMMTAILALENLQMDQVVTIDDETPFTEGSRIYLLEGEQVTVEQLLYSMMVESANDSAVALAIEIAGSVDAFAEMMNKRALELGAKNTNFVNPNGLHEDEHMSTAYDLAMIAKYAMNNPYQDIFRDVVTTYRYYIPPTNMQEERFLYNTNRLLYDESHKVLVNGEYRVCKYEYVTGIKTGYTSKAGASLAASAEKDGMELIAVVMQSTDMERYSDAITLLDYGFDNFKSVQTVEGGKDLGEADVKRGAVKQVKIRSVDDVFTTLPAGTSSDSIKTVIEINDSLQAPVKYGDQAGTIKVYLGAELLGEYPVIAVEEVEEGGILSIFGITNDGAKKIRNGILLVLGLLFALLVTYILLKRRQIRIRKERRRLRQERLQRQIAQQEAWKDDFWQSNQNYTYR